MGMMDYIIGKNVGREEGRNSPDSGAAHRAEIDAIQARGAADQAQDAALAIAMALKQTREELATVRKRFYRERRERRGWQRTAELRKLSLMEKAGMSANDVYDDQDRVSKLPGVSEHMNQFLDGEDKEIDADTIVSSTNTANNAPPSDMN